MKKEGPETAISVLIPAYNSEKYILETIDSVWPQLGRDDELIVMDDGSTDHTRELLQKYQADQRFKYRYKTHSNVPDTRNQAIAAATKPWIYWLDSDDIVNRGTLRLLKTYIRKFPDVDVFYGNIQIIDGQGVRLQNVKVQEYYRNNAQLVCDFFIIGDRIPQGSLVRRSVYFRFGGYDLSFTRSEDYEFWVRIAERAGFKKVRKYLYQWRWHLANRDFRKLAGDLPYALRIMDKMLKRYSLETIFCHLDWRNPGKAQAECYLKLGQIYLIRADYIVSLSHLVKSLEIIENNEALLLLLVVLYQLSPQKRVEMTASIPAGWLKRGIKLAKHREGVGHLPKYRIASLLAQMGFLPIAEKRFLKLQSILEAHPAGFQMLPGVYFHLGELYFQKNDWLKSQVYLKKCLERKPNHEKACEYLSKIESKGQS